MTHGRCNKSELWKNGKNTVAYYGSKMQATVLYVGSMFRSGYAPLCRLCHTLLELAHNRAIAAKV